VRRRLNLRVLFKFFEWPYLNPIYGPLSVRFYLLCLVRSSLKVLPYAHGYNFLHSEMVTQAFMSLMTNLVPDYDCFVDGFLSPV